MTTRRFHNHPLLWVVLVLVAAAAVGGVIVYGKLTREEPPPYFASDEDHFLFGSVGTEAQQGIPFWIWLVLPRVFPEYLPGPGGYASLGILAKDGHEMPIGFSKVTIGFPRVAVNCAMCHTASVRRQPNEPPTIVPAAPAHQAAPQQYLRFLFACASDPRFTADTLLAEIAKNYELSFVDRALYRAVIIPRTRSALLRLRDSYSWMQQRPEAGPGRMDAINAAKFRILQQPSDTTTGNADVPPLWNLQQHQGYAHGWDGLNSNLQEFMLASAIAKGATPAWLDGDFARWNNTAAPEMSSLRRVANYIGRVQPPRYLFPIDGRLAGVGSAIYQRDCASCHAVGGTRTGTVIPAAEIGTDRHRLDSWTSASATAYNAYGDGHPWKFSRFTTTGGYVSVPLEGVWLRAPYLHNGSVPSLADLLEDPGRRPARFWRGYDVYDPAKVGFVTSGPDAERRGTLFDVTQPGNSNAGHLFGTNLSPDEKRALVEYLKTL